MNSLRFSVSSLTTEEAKLIADAYFRSGQDIPKMNKMLDAQLPEVIVFNPLVKKEIVGIRNKMNEVYTLEDHLAKLKEIRDGALGDENWKVALSSEVAVGKAAGLYEKKPEDPNEGKSDVAKLSMAELRARLANMNPVELDPTPAPQLEDFSEENNEI